MPVLPDAPGSLWRPHFRWEHSANYDTSNLPPNCILCAWCQKVGMKLFTLRTATGSKAFCSELCFTQCRRASFKKNKVCDWCKHVRHTVNYVDFQDGEQQLQFCSDKCLNQYKMNIFCRETQAHLQMHPHLQEAKASGINLITPELWLRDCKAATSPIEANGNATPEREDTDDEMPLQKKSPSPVPVEPVHADPVNLTKRSKPPRQRTERRRFSRSLRSSKADVTPAQQENSHTLGSGSLSVPQHQTSLLRSPTSTSSTPLSSSSGSTGSHSQAILNGHRGSPPAQQPPMPPLTRVMPSSVPPHSGPLGGPDSNLRPPFLPPHPMLQVPTPQHLESLLRMQHQNAVRSGVPPPPFPYPPPCIPHPPFPPQRPHLPLPPHNSLLPPATVMVPYPIFLPIPVPIPIPIPIPVRKESSLSPQSSAAHGRSTSCPAETGDNASKAEADATEGKGIEVYRRRRRRALVEDDDMRDSVDTEDEDCATERSLVGIKASRSVTSLGSLQVRISKTVRIPGHLGQDSCSAESREKKRTDVTASDIRRDAKRKCSRH
ncbi:sine oculis-binding protein homolog isoform X2 [Ornithodoros turicata]|uniref:sine oculis-binding protein homolog isoform X2 n=1 Tax=Ornithodoros turicata TaxID=34597 RepID=UPI00313873B1